MFGLRSKFINVFIFLANGGKINDVIIISLRQRFNQNFYRVFS